MTTPNSSILSALDGIERYSHGETVYYTFLTRDEIDQRLALFPGEYGPLSGQKTLAELRSEEQGPIQSVIPLALSAWAAATSLRFVSVPPGDVRADIRFGFFDRDLGGGMGLNITATNDIMLSYRALDLTKATPGTATFQNILHEVGHALGLSGDGNLTGTGATFADTVMSYEPERNLDGVYPTTPMPYDIAKMQEIYGPGVSNPGNTTHGFLRWNADPVTLPMQTIFDTDGIDTLDFSQQNEMTFIDLNEGAYSSFGARNRQIGIAWGTQIENAYGGAGDDEIVGNELPNHLHGNGGNDTLDGGLGDDTYYVDAAGDVVTESAAAGTDHVYSSATFELGANIERLTLSGDAAIDGTGNEDANILTGNDAANLLVGRGGADQLLGGAGNDTLDGRDNAGGDTLEGGIGNDVYYVDDGDTIRDADGQGTIFLNGKQLSFATRRSGETVWTDGAGNTFALVGGQLQVNDPLVIEGFDNGELGIYLDEEEAPNDPDDPNDPSRPPLPPPYDPDKSHVVRRVDPLVLDLDGNNQIDAVACADSPIYFDFNGDGFLAPDGNGNGVVDGLGELFGSATGEVFALPWLRGYGRGRSPYKTVFQVAAVVQEAAR